LKPKLEEMASIKPLSTTEIAHELAQLDTNYKVTDASIRKIGQLLSKNDFIKRNKKVNGSSIKSWVIKRNNQGLSYMYDINKPLFGEN